MNRNERTPRTLADCSWHTGYASAHVSDRGQTVDRIAGVLLVLAVLLLVSALIIWGRP